MTATVPEFTRSQLSQVKVARNRPLLICDVDEVVVHFVAPLEDYLEKKSLWLDTSSFALSRNIKSKLDNEPLSDQDIQDLIDSFFVDATETLPAIEGAVDALLRLSQNATIVMLTNLPHHARDKRIRNLASHGLAFPVVTNVGPKGPVINHLAKLTSQPVVFIDDNPGFIESARSHAPDVHLVHFLQDSRYARHITPFDFVSLHTDTWSEALPHIETIFTR